MAHVCVLAILHTRAAQWLGSASTLAVGLSAVAVVVTASVPAAEKVMGRLPAKLGSGQGERASQSRAVGLPLERASRVTHTAARCLLLLQEQEGGGALVMTRDQVDMTVLNAAGGELQNALTNPFFGVL